MESFETLVEKILNNPDVQLIIKGMARFTSVNYYPEQYIKITFTDNSFLLLLTTQKELYYAEDYIISVPEVTDEELGIKEITVVLPTLSIY